MKLKKMLMAALCLMLAACMALPAALAEDSTVLSASMTDITLVKGESVVVDLTYELMGKIFVKWDNAYAIHDLNDTPDVLPEIFAECEKYGTQDQIIEVASFAKVTYPGSCVSCIIASDANLRQIETRLSFQTINFDKVNQLRHVRFFGDADGVRAHMRKQAAILRPKFTVVLDTLETALGGKGIACWTKPNGGYFVSLDVLDGCAKRVVALCKDAGCVLTGAGATYPHKEDPRDRNIRIAPTFPSAEELRQAMDVLCVCVEIACIEKILAE